MSISFPLAIADFWNTLGLIEGALLLFLVCDVAPKLGVKAFADYEGTYLLSFFMSHTPRGLVAALLP